jgi:CRISPR-associated endonuclease Csn1
MLRRSWGLQGIDEELGHLHVQNDLADEGVKGKNRGDNRHHSLDAIVVGYCSRSYVKEINTLSAKGIKAEEIMNMLPVPRFFANEMLDREAQKELFRKYVKTFLEFNGFVSWKIDNDKNGTLVRDTRYSVIASRGNNLLLAVKKTVKGIKVKTGKSEEIKTAIEGKMAFDDSRFPDEVGELVRLIQEENGKKFGHYQTCLPKARMLLEQQNQVLVKEGKKQIGLTAMSISKKALELCGGTFTLLSQNTRNKIFVVQEPTDHIRGNAFDTGANLCIDLYHDSEGKLQGEVIRKVQALKKGFGPTYRRLGYVLFERIYQGDILEVDIKDSVTGGVYKTGVAVGNAVPQRTFVRVYTFTEAGSCNIQIYFSNLAKSHVGQDESFMLTTMGKRHARKVTLSPAGLVSFVSPLLQDRRGQNDVESD